MLPASAALQTAAVRLKKKNLENKFAAEDATLAIYVQQLCSKL